MPSLHSTSTKILSKKPLALAVSLALASGWSAMAQAEEERVATLVVTASGFEQDVTQAPASITVITREELQRRQITSLADALNAIEGVDTRPLDARSGKTGNQTIQLRGLPSEYTLVLINGVRQNPAATVAPNAFGDTASVFIPPIAAIERIEVIRGPMSTLYGSDALGGVVNIITRQPSDEWTGSFSVNQTFQSDERFGGQAMAEGYVAGSILPSALSVQAYARLTERAESRINVPGTEPSLIDNRTMGQNPVGANTETLGVRFFYTPDGQNTFSLGYDRARQTYNNDRGQMGRIRPLGANPALTRDGYGKELGFERDQINLTHEGRFSFGQWNTSLTHDRIETTGRTIPQGYFTDPTRDGQARTLELETLIVDTRLTLPLGNHLLSFGGQYFDPEFTDGLMPSSISSSRYSVFVEDEWTLLPTVTLTGGLRYEDDDTVGSEVTPRLYVVWNTTDALTTKAGISQGFRTPQIEQTHDGVIGFGNNGETPLYGNPDLSAEKSTNFELSVVYDDYGRTFVQATYFFTQLEDKIESGTGANAGRDLNIGEAEIWGLELSGRYRLTEDLTLRANYTYTNSEVTQTQLDTGNPSQRIASRKGDPLVSTPEHMFNLSLDWQATDQLLTYIGAEYRGDAFRPRNFHEPMNGGNSQAVTNEGARDSQTVLGDFKGYTLVHLGARYQVTEQVSVHGRIDNLLDHDFIDYTNYTRFDNQEVASSNRYSSILPGRSLWLSVNVDF